MHTIKYVARQTGLSPHTIRAWERRYGALVPERTATNRRLYSLEDLRKLELLRKAVAEGHSIGQVAGLTVAELDDLTAPRLSRPQAQASAAEPDPEEQGAEIYLHECLQALDSFDSERLEVCLTRAAVVLGTATLVSQVVHPFLHQIGERWQRGELRPAQEHMATALLRTFLGRTLAAFRALPEAPRLVVTTPAGQLHELGALSAAIAAAMEGWRVLYLGPNLPAEEIAGAALGADAGAIALSLVFPPDDARVAQELAALRQFAGAAMPILVGGAASSAYMDPLSSIDAILVDDLPSLRQQLRALRRP